MTAKKSSSVKTSKVPNRDRSRYEDQFVKTKLCSFYEKGKCTRGAQCTFAHGSFELQQLPDLTKTSLCPALMQFGACDDDACLFAHGVQELRATKKFYKTSMCKFHLMRQCRMGGACRHAHDESELRMDLRLKLAEDPSLSSLCDGADSVYRQDSSISSASCPPNTFRQPTVDLDQDDVEPAGWPLWLDMSAESARPVACPRQYFQPSCLMDFSWQNETCESEKESSRLSPPWVSDFAMPAHNVLGGSSQKQAFELEQRFHGPPGLPRGSLMDITISL